MKRVLVRYFMFLCSDAAATAAAVAFQQYDFNSVDSRSGCVCVITSHVQGNDTLLDLPVLYDAVWYSVVASFWFVAGVSFQFCML